MTSPPLVSICMPAFNADRWIAQAVDSALTQTYERFELVVVDNGSTDDTVEIVRRYSDPRVRILTPPTKVSPGANHNRAVLASTGEFVKFLHADDLLLPECLDEMVALALRDGEIGLVFAPRELLVEEEPDAEWSARFGRPHEGFGRLAEVNDGRDLFGRLLDAAFEENWVGEPSAVLLRRSALARVGLLNERMHQLNDLELWARIMLGHKIGFVDRALAVYRHHGASGTAANARARRDWFDLPWLLEGLLASNQLDPDQRKRIVSLRRSVLRRALRAQLGRLARRDLTPELPAYAAYRARAAIGRAAPLGPSPPS